jgi:glycosyltransferase involved in cell wall biosynthesis
MKIGLITGEYPPMQGGVGDFTRELSTALASLGHEVHVITRVGCVGQARVSRLAVHPVMPNWGWRSHQRVMDLARRLALNVLNVQYQAAAYDLHPAINLFPWHARLNCRLPLRRGGSESLPRPVVVVTFHDLKVPYLFPKAGRLRDSAVTWLARYADASIVTNHADELALAARGVGHVARVPIGSNIAPVLPPGYDRDVWRARLGIEPDDLLLGFFGFFNARKGVETLVRALAALPHRLHLLFIGGTVGSSDATNRAYADHIAALIANLGLTERVHYTGYAPGPEVSAAFAAVDLCVLPYVDGISFHHGTLMAALAHGRPIISTLPQVELPELVHGGNVWLVPPEDPDALADAITTLAADLERRQRLARGATELAVEFTWQRIAARTADLFESVIRGT